MLLCTSHPTDGGTGRIFTNDGVFRVSSQTVSLQHSLTHPLIGIFPGFRVAVYCPNDNFHVHQSTVGIGGGGRRGRREETESCRQQPAPPPRDAAKMSPRIIIGPEPVLAAHTPSPPAAGSHCPVREGSAPQ
jgi:hypothetical protein